MLEKFLHEHRAIMDRDFVMIKIDTDKMTNGKEVAARLRKTRTGGIPWMVVLDPDGKELISSDGPEGNCGYPYQPHEIAHFLKMLRTTSTRTSMDDLMKLKGALDAYREKREGG